MGKYGNVKRLEKLFKIDYRVAKYSDKQVAKYSDKQFAYRATIGDDGLMYKWGTESPVFGITSLDRNTGYFKHLRGVTFIAPGVKGMFFDGVSAQQVVFSHEILHGFHSTYISSLGWNSYDNLARMLHRCTIYIMHLNTICPTCSGITWVDTIYLR